MADLQGKLRRHADLIPAILFIAAFLVTLFRFTQDLPNGGPGSEVMAVAGNLAREGSFANPLMVARTGPTAITAPLYPIYLAFLMRLGGNETRIYGWLMILSLMCAHGLHASLLPAVSHLFFGNRAPGIYAAAMFIVLPVFEVILVREAIYSAVGLMLFCLLSHRIAQSSWSAYAKGAAIGATCGLLVLLSPTNIQFCAAWTAYLFVIEILPRKSIGRIGIAFAGALALICLPWTIRNYRELGGWFFIRSNFGLELYVANNPCAEASLWTNMKDGCHDATHPNRNAVEAAKMKQMGELDYFKGRKQAALEWIFANPRRFWSLAAQRATLFWFPYRDVFTPAAGYSVCLVTAVALFGLSRLLRARRPIGFFILIASALFSGVYYFMQADMCYRYPILWVSLLCAGLSFTAASRPSRSYLPSD